jgi:hypothetical protein
MPISVECDQCGKQYRVTDESAGKKMRCRECQAVLTIPPAAKGGGKSAGAAKKTTRTKPVKDDDDYEVYDDDDRPSRSRRSSSSRSSPKKQKSRKSKSLALSDTLVRNGVLLVYIGFALLLLALIGGFIAGMALGKDLQTLLFVVRIIGFLVFTSNILTTIGKLLCLTAPPQMPGKLIIFLAVFFDLAGLSIGIAKLIMEVQPPLRDNLIPNLLALASLVSFVLFLRKLGDFMRDRNIPDMATGLLKTGMGIIALYVLLILLVLATAYNIIAPIPAGIGLLLVIIGLLVLGVIGTIRYGALLNSCLSELS